MQEKQLMENLKAEGYTKVYIHDAKPNEEYPKHDHPWNTKLIIMEGELQVEIENDSKVLHLGESIEIPQNKIHSGKAGAKGCCYIVEEKN